MIRKLSAVFLAAFIFLSVPAYAFTDVQTHWAKQYIEFARDEKLLKGYPDGTYAPEDKVTRAQFATMITSHKKGTISDVFFPDVTVKDWFYGFVGYAVNNSIMSGYPDGTFRPQSFISRAEVAATIKSMEYPNEMEASSKFSDALPSWAANAIHVTAKHGIFSGDPQNRFRPEDSLTRAEAAVILTKMKGFVVKQ